MRMRAAPRLAYYRGCSYMLQVRDDALTVSLEGGANLTSIQRKQDKNQGDEEGGDFSDLGR